MGWLDDEKLDPCMQDPLHIAEIPRRTTDLTVIARNSVCSWNAGRRNLVASARIHMVCSLERPCCKTLPDFMSRGFCSSGGEGGGRGSGGRGSSGSRRVP